MTSGMGGFNLEQSTRSLTMNNVECCNFFFFMVYHNFEQLAIFALKEGDKSILNDMCIKGMGTPNYQATNLQLMHDGCNDYDAVWWGNDAAVCPCVGICIMWSSQQTRTPGGASNQLVDATWRRDLHVDQWVHTISKQYDWGPGLAWWRDRHIGHSIPVSGYTQVSPSPLQKS